MAHNAPFDLSVLRKCLAAYHIPAQDLWYLCTFQASKHLLPQLPNHKLDTLCNFLGIGLQHHNAASDASACAQLLLRMLQMDHIAVERCITGTKMDCSEPDKASHARHGPSETTQALHDLKLLVSAMTADNQLTEGEVTFLYQWAMSNRHLGGNYPYDRILATIEAALMDGILEQCELDELLEVLKATLDPVQYCCEKSSAATLDIVGKSICLTGDFDRCSRSQAEKELAEIGAIVQKGVTRKTDYLIVGGQGSAAWSAGNYGNKVKKALELQSKGLHIQIVQEADFYNWLEGSCVGV